MLVHNGIIENHAELKSELAALGYTFVSDTDTEAAAKPLDHDDEEEMRDPAKAIAKTDLGASLGAYALPRHPVRRRPGAYLGGAEGLGR